MESMHTIREELRQPATDLRELIPDVMGHAEIAAAAMREGELSRGGKGIARDRDRDHP